MPQFQYAVVGRGLTGSAAARHLAEQVPGVVLIGPDEPHDWASHQGVFASHYDEGRITRTIDPNEVWARLANRSIARYREIEAKSGVTFYGEKGCLISGLKTGRSQTYMANIRAAAARVGVEPVLLDDEGLKATFSYFSFPDGSDAVFEPVNAGYVSPRRLVAAQTIAAEKAGASVIRKHALSIAQKHGYAEITLEDGETVSAARVLVAAGGFTNQPGLLPDVLDMQVYGRTISLFEVSEAEAARLASMPSLIFEDEPEELGVYMLPPILYPDGKHYLKIGGDMTDILLENTDAVRDWFKSGGSPRNFDHLVGMMKRLVPSLDIKEARPVTCVTSYPHDQGVPTKYPAIGPTSAPSIFVMAGGCGAAAKSSDEIGRLGAELLVHGEIVDPAYPTADFRPRFV
ncbi:FAD-binding oxidoreductase [Rhizobium sp. FKL33]|uniref:NAD(P)/FAD-dependent oxidoreductase n=1 Tax=Rhizobium sp. FKL33 TaxID=2562307 RepID=UPI0010BFF6A9|nr:FAD-binding oxidoreductase [Rhizobium sp. FKL33]